MNIYFQMFFSLIVSVTVIIIFFAMITGRINTIAKRNKKKDLKLASVLRDVHISALSLVDPSSVLSARLGIFLQVPWVQGYPFILNAMLVRLLSSGYFTPEDVGKAIMWIKALRVDCTFDWSIDEQLRVINEATINSFEVPDVNRARNVLSGRLPWVKTFPLMLSTLIAELLVLRVDFNADTVESVAAFGLSLRQKAFIRYLETEEK